jgi:hypothetical protein
MIVSRIAVLLSLVSLPLCSVLPASATMSVSLQPPTAYVLPDQVFTLDFTVDYSDSLFNSYEAVLQWDSAKFRYVETQAGPLMPPDFWFEVAAGEDSVRIRHAITYGVYGPGIVSQLTLRALVPSEGQVTFRRARFSYGGNRYYNPALHGAIVIVLDPTSTVREPTGGDLPRVRVVPNPATAGSRIFPSLPGGGPSEVALFDPAGRLLLRRWLVSGGSNPVGSGIDLNSLLDGRVLPSGMYGIVVSTNRSRASTRFVIIR